MKSVFAGAVLAVALTLGGCASTADQFTQDLGKAAGTVTTATTNAAAQAPGVITGVGQAAVAILNAVASLAGPILSLVAIVPK